MPPSCGDCVWVLASTPLGRDRIWRCDGLLVSLWLELGRLRYFVLHCVVRRSVVEAFQEVRRALHQQIGLHLCYGSYTSSVGRGSQGHTSTHLALQ